uniref:Uncharacterized protein n=1 Tax=Xenopus tropicalis TaxID=8364 RepID=A0A6I8Q759_XENTR
QSLPSNGRYYSTIYKSNIRAAAQVKRRDQLNIKTLLRKLLVFSFSFSYFFFHCSAVSSTFTHTVFLMVLRSVDFDSASL